MEVRLQIERLIHFALQKELIEHEDVHFVRNTLFDILSISEPLKSQESSSERLDNAEEILEHILDYACAQNIISNTTTEREYLDSKLMGVFISKPSEIARKFAQIAHNHSIQHATSFFYHLSKASNYIRTNRILRNKYWQYHGEFGDLEITINLSKPEKDPKDIAKARMHPQSSSYPLCALCVENVGFAGSFTFAARQNHRVIPLLLSPTAETNNHKNTHNDVIEGNHDRDDKESRLYYFQYSPYEYYTEHCIVIDATHRVMEINRRSIALLFSFIDQFPHYFIGSNAELPIVGGSILSHNHFQGGKKSFPIDRSRVDWNLLYTAFADVKICTVRWYLSTIRLTSRNSQNLIALSAFILDQWRGYSDPSVDIVAHTFTANNEPIIHNTITPILRLNELGEFQLDLILRNNRTSAEHPDGIFHPHTEQHHIKKENIGLIEAIGLAILPGRLQSELALIASILTSTAPFHRLDISENSPLYKHLDWIEDLIAKYGQIEGSEDGERVNEILRNEVGRKFSQVLMDAAVFKWNQSGRSAFRAFLQSLHFQFIDDENQFT